MAKQFHIAGKKTTWMSLDLKEWKEPFYMVTANLAQGAMCQTQRVLRKVSPSAIIGTSKRYYSWVSRGLYGDM